jgi:hypothetical protein
MGYPRLMYVSSASGSFDIHGLTTICMGQVRQLIYNEPRVVRLMLIKPATVDVSTAKIDGVAAVVSIRLGQSTTSSLARLGRN